MTPPPRRPSPWRRREVRARIRRLPEPPARSVPTLVQPSITVRPRLTHRAAPPPVPSFAVVHNRRKTARTKSFRGSSSIRDAKVGQGTFLFDSDEDERDDDRGLTGGTGEIAIAKIRAANADPVTPTASDIAKLTSPPRSDAFARASDQPHRRANTSPPAFDHPSTPSYSATACDANVLEARGSGGEAVPSRAAARDSNPDRGERRRKEQRRGDGGPGPGVACHPGTRPSAVAPCQLRARPSRTVRDGRPDESRETRDRVFDRAAAFIPPARNRIRG